MPKIGRNDSCPCGSGKKYKRCCMDKDQSAEYAPLAAKRAELAAMQEDHRLQIQDLQAAMQGAHELDDASNAVIDLIRAGKLDEAERAARDLLVRYPEVPDGHERLGMLYEARGQRREAANCYRSVIDFIRANPEDYDPAMNAHFLRRIAELDPPAGEG